MEYRFPFGEKVNTLTQQDKTPKDIFVLGVYASAVHAKWVKDKFVICQALAVASEPYIFWDGNPEEAQTIIDRIHIPEEVGRLVLPNRNLNGPSAKILDEKILAPLGYKREEAWLCDLLPQSRLNQNQQKVIKEKYNPLISQYHLNPVTVPPKNGSFYDSERCKEITDEILSSKAEKLVLLGDNPIKQYLSKVCDIDFSSLGEYTKKYGYAKPYPINIAGKYIEIIPVTHPRQIGGLGEFNAYWFETHEKWMEDTV